MQTGRLLTGGQPDIVGYTHDLFPLSVCAILSTPDLPDVSHKALFPRHLRLSLSLSLCLSSSPLVIARLICPYVRTMIEGEIVFLKKEKEQNSGGGAVRLKRIGRITIVLNLCRSYLIVEQRSRASTWLLI